MCGNARPREMITSSSFGWGRQNSAYRSLPVTDCSPHSPSDPGPADEVLRELLPEFFAAWDRDLCKAYPEIIAVNDIDALHRLGHTIKGSMIQFGFPRLATIGVALIQDAKQVDFTAATERITDLQNQLSNLRDRFS